MNNEGADYFIKKNLQNLLTQSTKLIQFYWPVPIIPY